MQMSRCRVAWRAQSDKLQVLMGNERLPLDSLLRQMCLLTSWCSSHLS